MGQSVSVQWDGSPQEPCAQDAEASIVFSSLSEDPHGQIRLPRAQCACEPKVWTSILRAAKEHLQYTQPHEVHSPKKDPMAVGAKELIAKMVQEHAALRFSYKGVWITWNTEANGQRILDGNLNHWEHVLHIRNPAGPVRSSASSKAPKRRKSLSDIYRLEDLSDLPDPRQPIDPELCKLRFEPLSALPPELHLPPSSTSLLKKNAPLATSSPECCPLLPCFEGMVRSVRGADHSKIVKDVVEKLECFRWYKIYPISEYQWLLRPELGPIDRIPRALQIPGIAQVSDRMLNSESTMNSGVRRRWSVPDFVERKIDLEDPPGFECDAFRNCCRICYEQVADVLAFPCGHGGLCEDCLRYTIMSRPAHRGGRACPFCRRKIEQVARLYRHASIQYAYCIKMF
mmetsp:Transcript_58178/g.101881  ORF Transcript_58178/g.101881 Transcript_58178/m.101881 type:complete len:400 (-) Transcript_58178:77-1276(-)